jgi:hypothetical protein
MDFFSTGKLISSATRLALLVIAAAAAVAGCGVESYDDAVANIDQPPAPPPPGSPPPPPPPPGAGFDPSFSVIQDNVFTPDCTGSGCHAGSVPAAGLNLEEANSYAMLVGIESSQAAGILRVDAGDPDNSYLVQKLEGNAASGQQMPPGGALPQAEIDVIRQWITDGALDDRVATLDPVSLTSLAPMPGAELAESPQKIVAGFSRELNQATVDATTFLLTASGGDGSFADGNETPIMAAAISVPAANPQSAVFDLGDATLGDDSYRIQLLGAAANAIQDLDGNALDGEYPGSLPSGDGVPGGDFAVQFTVTTPVAATLDEIQAAVFTPTCAASTCHNGANPAGGLDLRDADTSFAQLVDVPSGDDPGILRVAPGDPDNSYLVQKIEGTAAQGQQMPPGNAPPLSQAEIDAIRQWIGEGAAR